MYIKSIATIFVFLCLLTQSTAQSGRDTLKQRIFIEHADETSVDNRGRVPIQRLKGNVRVYQDSTFMFCDSAVLIKNHLRASGNVVIVQSDTISAFGDSLYYNGNNGLARLFDDVTLENGEQKLYTQFLTYDVRARLATYLDTALMISETTYLQSKRGRYEVRNKLAYFYKDVVVRDSTFHLRTDSLKFHTGLKRAIFISPTEIEVDSATIYTREGYYDFSNEVAHLTGRPQYLNGDTRAIADSIHYIRKTGEIKLMGHAVFRDSVRYSSGAVIYYNELTGETRISGEGIYRDEDGVVVGDEISFNEKSKELKVLGRGRVIKGNYSIDGDEIDYSDSDSSGVATGNVEWRDMSNHMMILGERVEYSGVSTSIRALGNDELRPVMVRGMDDDSLFLAADTLMAYDSYLNSDTIQNFKAYYDVRLYKSNMQGIADSLYYNSQDSVFILYGHPIIWSDTTQFTADTIYMYLKGEGLDRIHLRKNAFIINNVESEYYNQIRGRDVEAFFQGDTLSHMIVQGNAESIYFMQDDDKAFIGANTTVCSKILFTFANDDLRDIRFYDTPTSKLIPIRDINPLTFRLVGFRWQESIRPIDEVEIRKWNVGGTFEPIMGTDENLSVDGLPMNNKKKKKLKEK